MLAFGWGIIGISAATGITAWLNVGMLAWGLKRRGLLGFDPRLARAAPRIVLATLAMAAFLAAIQPPFADWWSGPLANRAIALGLLIGGGLLTYGIVILASGAATPGEFRSLFRRQRRAA